ncbi:MAG: 16S rRNA (cytosine(1402)-N(4))-methyltransferase RsmH [Proteobacteria bacterium]|nr:16S rRNA (cytosine(1402)-N(4))-methyltransferase RsmH [Pseudomonadota bacterium]
MSDYHIPIMSAEVVSLLRCGPGGTYVDCTLGGGGHSEELLKASSPDGRLIGIDRDREAIDAARKRLTPYGERASFVHSDYKSVKEVLEGEGIAEVDGILADLGVSSWQLDSAGRGFSFMKEGPLDMRMDRSSGETAAELIERLSERELSLILWQYGEEKWAKLIARAIKAQGDIGTTLELAELVSRVVPRKAHPKRIHVATRTFQGLRIAVNEELAGLDRFLIDAISMLRDGGRLAVITFHSLEDRIVKRVFRNMSKPCICPPDLPLCACGKAADVRVVTGKAVSPTVEELERNPRSRSARLRVAEKI